MISCVSRRTGLRYQILVTGESIFVVESCVTSELVFAIESCVTGKSGFTADFPRQISMLEIT